ncbi:hypothetical protein [Pseudomonas huanghezhanensis]|uniref:hypothetical protein n=1 Tax=Pseudomonas huanghezhanensis TaxID=3002903 RepID=UPI002286C498|nr:hypothetical protein [Pseudomonas sp. BSw22131]
MSFSHTEWCTRVISRFAIPCLILFLCLGGCKQDQSLDPPADSEQITVTVKVPEELEAETMQVMYRSTLCTFINHDANGEPYTRDGYQQLELQPVRQGTTDLYQAKLAIDGGGACKWRLSNVTFGVVYAYPTRFGENVRYGAGGGVVVVFDHNNSSHSGVTWVVDGDLTIRESYYPWVHESLLGRPKLSVSLTGEGKIYLGYKALNARSVYFEPVVHSDFVLYSKGPAVKKDGNFTSFTYPDGSVFADGRWHPNFRKLEAIRLAAQSKP